MVFGKIGEKQYFSKFILNLKVFFQKNSIIFAIFFISFIVGFFWSHYYYFSPIADIYTDQQVYFSIADNLLNGEGFTFKNGDLSNLDPGYPLLLAVLLEISNYSIDFVRFFQLFLSSLTSVLIYLIAIKIFNKKIALFAGFFSSLFWVFPNYSPFLLRESSMIFFSALFIYQLIRINEKAKYRDFIIAGLLFGILTLINSVFQYFLIFIIINFFIIFKNNHSGKQILKYTLTFILSFFILVSPWAIRNIVHADDIVSRSSMMISMRANFMETLYPEMPKYFFGHLTGYHFFEKLWPELDPYAFRDIYAPGQKIKELQKDMTEKEAIQTLKDSSLEYILHNPHKYILMSFLDFLNLNSPFIPNRIFRGNGYLMLAFTEEMNMDAPEIFKGSVVILGRLFWYTFLSLVVYGIYINRRNYQKISWLLLMIIFINIIYSAIHTLPRYAVPIYPFYIIFASSAFYYLISKYIEKYEI